MMGGEDWEMWIDALAAAGVLAPGVVTVAYSYIGPDLTWAIYRNGTIGRAKEDLEASRGSHHAQTRGEGRPRVCQREQGARDAGEQRDSRRAALHFAALQSDEGKGTPRRVHRADLPALCRKRSRRREPAAG